MTVDPGSETFSNELFRDNLADAINPGAGLTLDDNTVIRQLKGWDSVASASVVAMVYAEYDVQISGDELVGCETVGKLADLVQSKLGK